MYDSDGNLLNRPKYAATLTGPNGSIREVSDNASGYGMMRGGSRAGTQASGSYFSRRHSGVSGASFRSGGSKGTGISASSFGQKSDALTSISRRNPRGGDGSSSYTGRSFSSSKLAPRSYGRTAPLSLKSSRYGGSRKGSNRGFDDESAFSRDTDGSGGSSGLTSRTAGTKWEASTAKGSTKYSAFSSGTMRSKSSGLKMSNSDLGASQSGLTSSAFGRAKRFREYEDDDDSEVLMGGGPSTSAGRSYVQGGSSAFGGGTSALGGKGLKLAQSDLLYGGSSLNGSSARKLFTT